MKSLSIFRLNPDTLKGEQKRDDNNSAACLNCCGREKKPPGLPGGFACSVKDLITVASQGRVI